MQQASVPGRNGSPRALLRGDLCSNTGYARANRALASLLRLECEVIGADIHPDAHDNRSPPDFPLVSDHALFAMAAAPARNRSIVLHCTSPDSIRHFPGAVNVGAFYWETDAIPHRRDWPLKLSLLDTIWAPTRFVAEFARSAGYQGRIDLIPWAHSFDRAGADAFGAETPVMPQVEAQFIGTLDADRVAPTPIGLPSLRQQARQLFLAVQSLAPRKGTRTLLREWRTYLHDHGKSDVLVLRLAFRHATDIHDPPMVHFAKMLRAAGFRPGDRTNIALLVDPMTVDDLRGLYRCCNAFVTASFGEGFGGPVIEALQQGCLVVAPRHTGLADLLPPDYPLVVNSRRVVTGLVGNLDVYPASASWNIPEPGAIATALSRVAAFSPHERRAALDMALAHAMAFCSIPVVRERIQLAFNAIAVTQPPGVPQGVPHGLMQ